MRVHTVATHPVEVEVDYQGQKAMAMLPQCTVELMNDDAGHGSMTLHFRGKEIPAAKAMFVHGQCVTMTFSKAEAAPAVISTEAEVTEPAA
jgi:hypothetical protein